MQVDKYRVTLDFTNRLHGGIPATGEDDSADEREARYAAWLTAQGSTAELEAATVRAAELATDETMPEAEIQVNGFRQLNGSPVLETRQVKAMLREAAQRLGYIKAMPGTRQVIQHDLVVRPIDNNGDFLPLGVRVITGIEERPIHVNTPQGPKNAITLNEYVEDGSVEFEVWVLKGGVADSKATSSFTEDKLRSMLDYCEVFSALGANRSQGYGRFNVRELERVSG